MISKRQPISLSDILIEAVKAQRCVLFLGAGASKEALNSAGGTPPNATQLGEILAQKFFNKKMPNRDVMAIAEMAIAQNGSAAQVYEEVRKAFKGFSPQQAHKLLPTFNWRAIATTNYDLIVEDAYKEVKNRIQDLVPIVKDDEPIDGMLREASEPLPYLKLHGCLNHIHDADIPPVLSREMYSVYARNRLRLFSRLQDMANEHIFIFIGYRLDDDHIRNLIYTLETNKRPRWYMVTPDAEKEDIDFWATKKVEVIKARFGEFILALDDAVPPLFRKLQHSSDVIDFPVRKFYKSKNIESDKTNNSLGKDLLFIHSEIATEPQTAKQFYSGYDTGWGAIIQRYDVRRQVEEDILFKAFLENETPDGPVLITVKGPAGSGKTVALKRSAYEAATTSNSLVLWLISGGVLRPDVFIEIHELTGKTIFLFVDDAALKVDELFNLLKKMRSEKIPLVVIAAERDADWNTYCEIIEGEFPGPGLKVRYLSPKEINGLLDLLKKHNCLGLLANETREEQVRQFETVAERQLLVALHQLTQGQPFEEVLKLEHQRINPEQARQLYLDIATMHQYGVTARAGTISRISGITFSDYEQKFFDPLQNIVHAEIDRYSRDYSYRTRHAHVAQLVFKQACQTDFEKAFQFSRLIGGLDCGYSSDAKALEQITKGRLLAGAFAEAEFGRQIYETAIEAAPRKTFLYQQRALFELHHPHGSTDEAEKWAAEAREIDERNLAVIHTQAEIDRIRANKATSTLQKEQLRRRARERLNELPKGSRFAVSSRCKLLVDEIADLKSDLLEDMPDHTAVHFSDKVREAEDRLRLALQEFPNDADIAQVEARFRDELGQEDRALRALEKAIRLSPKGSGAVIRIARIYKDRDQAPNALKVLLDAQSRNPDDKAIHSALAKHYLADASVSDDLIEGHLKRAFSSGDGNFEARFELAQFLFSRGEITQAENLFEEINRRAPATFRNMSDGGENIFTRRIPVQSGYVQALNGHTFFIRSGCYSKNIYSNKSLIREGDFEDISIGGSVTFKVRFNITVAFLIVCVGVVRWPGERVASMTMR